MRIAVLVVGLVFAGLIALQAMGFFGFGIGADMDGVKLGFTVAAFFLLGAAFAIGIPQASVASFAIASGFVWIFRRYEGLPLVFLAGFLGIVLALMSLAGYFELKQVKQGQEGNNDS